MKKAVMIVAVVASIIGLLAWAGSYQGQEIGRLRLFALAAGAALILQWVAFIPSLLASTEKYYDLMGGVTFVSLTAFLLILTPSVSSIGWFCGLMVIAWSLRLASFLFARVKKSSDKRFDDIKKNPGRFLVTWTLQGLWVAATASAAWIAITSSKDPGLPILFWIGLFIWILGFAIEITADRQKSAFKADPANEGRFIDTGLWSKSRHPNYFGEILLWTGMFIAACSTFVGILSPLVTTLLLTECPGFPFWKRRPMSGGVVKRTTKPTRRTLPF